MFTNVKLRLLALLALPLVLVLITGADHRDAPGVLNDPAVDINDVYAFVNQNTGNVVLAMTVNPFQAPGINATFSPNALYQFKIDNTGDAIEDLVIQVTFSEPDNTTAPATTFNPAQKFTLHGPAKPTKLGPINTLVTGGNVISGSIDNSAAGNFTTDTSTGIKVFAGLRDDPFFFDEEYILPLLANPSGFVPPRKPGIDFFAGVNVSIIAVEIPPAMIKGNNGNIIKVWATTNTFSSSSRSIKTPKGGLPEATIKGAKTYTQFDRMALPAVNTALIFPNHKDAFNFAVPSEDKALFRNDVVEHIALYNAGDMKNAGFYADVVLPDVLTLDVTNTVGFGSVSSNGNLSVPLNGRRPEDNVIAVELFVFSNGAFMNLNPTANDVPFLSNFPFFAPPHQAGQGVPPRN